jgi:catechol 2,3-dioxygenase-like lactoylglutathione lyase family enzyme
VTTPMLRQVVLLAADLPRAITEARSFLGLHQGVRDAEGMADIGFEHEVLAIDQTFVEIVTPLSADTSPGRLLARQGECGYMVVVQVADLDAVMARAEGAGLAPIMHTTFEGNPISQWHPRDLGTLAEIDQISSGIAWHLCPALSDTGSTDVVTDITAVGIAVPDPPAAARRWALLLGLTVDQGSTGVVVGGQRLDFVPRDDRGDGLRTVALAARDQAAPVAERDLCGVTFTFGGPVPAP